MVPYDGGTVVKELDRTSSDRPGPDRSELSDLAERATHAMRNVLGNMVALAYVLDDSSGVDREVVSEMRRNLELVALDAELLADLAVFSSGPEERAAPLRTLLGDAVRPFQWFTWLGGAEGGSIEVVSPAELEAPFLRPTEVTALARRLIASVIGRARARAVVLEAAPAEGGVLLIARSAEATTPVDQLPEIAAEPGSGGNYLDLEVLAWYLRRPGLSARLYLSPDGAVAAARLAPRAD
jgi:hypothetical protein